jgi:hypothetical protein
MNYGTVTRSKPKVRVVRGFDPNEPTTGQRALPVKAGVTIKSGQVISSKFNGTTARLEWVLGLDAAATQGYIALVDSTDFDSVAADLLVGLPCSGKFTIETAYYKSGDTYSDGAYLTADGTTGDLKVTALESGEPIFGMVRLPDDAATNSGLRVVNGTVGSNFVDTYSSVTSPAIVLRFDTTHLPNTADAT